MLDHDRFYSGRASMKRILVAAVAAVTTLAFAGSALAAEAKGLIKNINARVITI
jgi:hypothetical protein